MKFDFRLRTRVDRENVLRIYQIYKQFSHGSASETKKFYDGYMSDSLPKSQTVYNYFLNDVDLEFVHPVQARYQPIDIAKQVWFRHDRGEIEVFYYEHESKSRRMRFLKTQYEAWSSAFNEFVRTQLPGGNFHDVVSGVNRNTVTIENVLNAFPSMIEKSGPNQKILLEHFNSTLTSLKDSYTHVAMNEDKTMMAAFVNPFFADGNQMLAKFRKSTIQERNRSPPIISELLPMHFEATSCHDPENVLPMSDRRHNKEFWMFKRPCGFHTMNSAKISNGRCLTVKDSWHGEHMI